MKRKASAKEFTTRKKSKTTVKRGGLGTSNRNLPEIQIASKKGLNPETKMVDVSGSLSLSNTGTGAGHTILINGVIPGTEIYNRIGRKINCKSVNIRCQVQKSAAQTVVADTLRFALIWDEQPVTGTLPAFGDIWSDVSNAGAVTTPILAHANFNNTARFRILRSHIIPIDVYNANAPYQMPQEMYWDWNVPLNTITHYNAGVTGGVSDISTGALYFVGHGANSATAVFTVTVSSRLKYLD